MVVVAAGLVVLGAVGAAIAVIYEAPRFARWYHHAHHA
jgi:preprotein translocase subunit Sss1